eukprot:6177985-Pleurochrysis_carterae.AAC.3
MLPLLSVTHSSVDVTSSTDDVRTGGAEIGASHVFEGSEQAAHRLQRRSRSPHAIRTETQDAQPG